MLTFNDGLAVLCLSQLPLADDVAANVGLQLFPSTQVAAYQQQVRSLGGFNPSAIGAYMTAPNLGPGRGSYSVAVFFTPNALEVQYDHSRGWVPNMVRVV